MFFSLFIKYSSGSHPCFANLHILFLILHIRKWSLASNGMTGLGTEGNISKKKIFCFYIFASASKQKHITNVSQDWFQTCSHLRLLELHVYWTRIQVYVKTTVNLLIMIWQELLYYDRFCILLPQMQTFIFSSTLISCFSHTQSITLFVTRGAILSR